MITPDYVRTMARYNSWQNGSLFGAADGLNDKERDRNRGAFFGSIRGTLNHLYWADRLWMSRFTSAIAEPPLSAIAGSVDIFSDWPSLVEERKALDGDIIDWAGSLTEDYLDQPFLHYKDTLGHQGKRPLALCVVHMFNHQTHHRGQVHAMLTAAGAEPDDTDLTIMPGNE